MKSVLLIVLPADTAGIETALHEQLEPFRLLEDDERSVRSRHWDYWYFRDERNVWSTGSPPLTAGTPEDVAKNLALVQALRDDYCPAGLLTPDGVWHDLSDFGWKLTTEPGRENDAAFQRWRAEFRRLIGLYPAHFAVEVVVHC